jgi:hypothetical protein
VNDPAHTDDQPSWSPNGSAIAFTTNRNDGKGNDIYVAGPGGAGSPVASSMADDHDPAFSPDGSRVAFSSTRGGSPAIWTVGSGGTEQGPADLRAAGDQPDWAQLAPTGGPGGPAAPVIGKTLNASVVSGTVTVSAPTAGGARAKFVPLAGPRQFPVGSQFDTSRGTLRLTLAASLTSAATQSGTVRGGRFATAQSTRNPLTELRLAGGSLAKCDSKRPRGGAAAARKRSRQLFANVKGRFRTRGRNSTATVRGTQWLTKDTCAGTLTVVKSGTVVVRDLAKRKTVSLKKGQRYMARSRRG